MRRRISLGVLAGALCKAELKPIYFILSSPQTATCFAGIHSSS